MRQLLKIACTVLVIFVFSIVPANSGRPAEAFPGTKPLDLKGDLASEMVAGIDRFLLREIDASVQRRPGLWKRDTSSPEHYYASVAMNRASLRVIMGARDAREKVHALELVATTDQPALVGRGAGFDVFAVRWPVLRGVQGEGLLLKPTSRQPVADCIAIPDADQTPEMLVGLVSGIPAESQFARRLAESGCRVLIPTLIDRADTYSASSAGRKTNQPHREYIYRAAFELGRHVIGYEVQKVQAAVDWFEHESGGKSKIGVYGYGEGGLLALYAGALDTRIKVTCTSGYFDSRQQAWQEPIYRNVWALLHEFGDAELASLVAPRALIVEACRGPEVAGPPAPHDGRGGAAPGRLATPLLARVKQELDRAKELVAGLTPAPGLQLVAGNGGAGPFGSDAALTAFLGALNPGSDLAPLGLPLPKSLRKHFDPQMRLKRQFDQLDQFTQRLLGESENVRRAFWQKADRRSIDSWVKTTAWYRDYFANEVVGRFDRPPLPPNARSRKVYDDPKFTGYEVVLDVFPEVFAYGILLVPKDIRDGERRPVVVCQHGLEGRPQDVADPHKDNPAYHTYAARLAERGFITYAPQNPYIFTDRFRTLQRKSNLIKKTLFSTIVPQHQATVDWLASLPMVDPERIAFYGLSYGGKTAMRVPPLVTRYCLSICSADFNEWVWKNTSTSSPYSYVTSGEYEIFEWDLGSTFNYAEMAALIAPRPFMVERGHHDGVAPDETVAYEYAKVRYLYVNLKIPERTTIEFFDGPHTIRGVGTFAFLHQHLKWPVPPDAKASAARTP
jgi:dienelactone hydrolase